MYSRAQLQGKTSMSSTRVLLMSFSRVASIIVKYMDIISGVLAWYSTGNLIITDGPCLLGHQVKKREDNMWI